MSFSKARDRRVLIRLKPILVAVLICAGGGLGGCGDDSSEAARGPDDLGADESIVQSVFSCDPVDTSDFQTVIPAEAPDAAWRAEMSSGGWYWLVARFGQTRASWLVQDAAGGAVTVLVGNSAAQERMPEALTAAGNGPEDFLILRESAESCLDEVQLP